MACEPFTIEGVRTGIICSRGLPAPRCRYCRSAGTVAEPIKECDYPKREGGTCDVRCCAAHSLHVGDDLDYCPTHAPFVFPVGTRKIVVVNQRSGVGGEAVDGTSPLASPFRSAARGREQAVSLYRRWLWVALNCVGSAQAVEIARLAEAVRQNDLTLVCHCAPKKCHAQVIARAVRWSAEKL